MVQISLMAFPVSSLCSQEFTYLIKDFYEKLYKIIEIRNTKLSNLHYVCYLKILVLILLFLSNQYCSWFETNKRTSLNKSSTSANLMVLLRYIHNELYMHNVLYNRAL